MVKYPEQPKWLYETVVGLSSSRLYSAFLEGKKYAIVHAPGHTEYLDRGSGNAYCPTEYILVEKGKNYWSHTWKKVHTGRLTNKAQARMKEILKRVEHGQSVEHLIPER